MKSIDQVLFLAERASDKNDPYERATFIEFIIGWLNEMKDNSLSLHPRKDYIDTVLGQAIQHPPELQVIHWWEDQKLHFYVRRIPSIEEATDI